MLKSNENKINVPINQKQHIPTQNPKYERILHFDNGKTNTMYFVSKSITIFILNQRQMCSLRRTEHTFKDLNIEHSKCFEEL